MAINKSKTKKAYTLAEVLIVLCALGVIALLTMNVLISSMDKVRNKTSAGKVFVDLNRALMAFNGECLGMEASCPSTNCDNTPGQPVCCNNPCIKTGIAGLRGAVTTIFLPSLNVNSMTGTGTTDDPIKVTSIDGTVINFAYLSTNVKDCPSLTKDIAPPASAAAQITIEVNGKNLMTDQGLKKANENAPFLYLYQNCVIYEDGGQDYYTYPKKN